MRYFAMIDGKQAGPFELEELAGAGVGPDTYVWCKGMDEWHKAEEVGDICRYFRLSLSGQKPHDEKMFPVEHSGDKEVEQRDIPLKMRYYLRKSGTEVRMRPEEEPDYDSRPASMLWAAVLTFLLCCPLTGLVAIICSLRASRLWRQGKKKEAHGAAQSARIWVLITFFAGFFMVAFIGKATGIF